MIDPGHRALASDLEQLGRRQLPVLQFLPRNHPVNRWLGRLRRRFTALGPPEGEAVGARS
jgi:hypothetical protein